MIIPERKTKRGNTVPAFQVDDCFAEEVNRWVWGVDAYGYIVRRRRPGEECRLHRFVWKLSGRSLPSVLDHVNCDPLDNRLENLRAASKSLNALNSGRKTKTRHGLPRGIHRLYTGRFCAFVGHRSKKHHLGTFDTFEEASAAYENAREILIEFANLPGYEEVIRCQR